MNDAPRITRMIGYLLVAVFFYAASILIPQPQVQTVAFKLGNALVAGYAGFWIYQHTSKEMPATPYDQLAQSLVVAACMVAIGLGL